MADDGGGEDRMVTDCRSLFSTKTRSSTAVLADESEDGENRGTSLLAPQCGHLAWARGTASVTRSTSLGLRAAEHSLQT
jgi:hypothetical protein